MVCKPPLNPRQVNLMLFDPLSVVDGLDEVKTADNFSFAGQLIVVNSEILRLALYAYEDLVNNMADVLLREKISKRAYDQESASRGDDIQIRQVIVNSILSYIKGDQCKNYRTPNKQQVPKQRHGQGDPKSCGRNLLPPSSLLSKDAAKDDGQMDGIDCENFREESGQVISVDSPGLIDRHNCEDVDYQRTKKRH
jgi:hypothetical protein